MFILKKSLQQNKNVISMLIVTSVIFHFIRFQVMSKKIDKYIINKKLGSGAFADVYLVQDSTNNKQYAMKSILKEKLNYQLVAKLQNEIAIIQAVNHPNIVHSYDLLQSNSRYFIIMDYISGGDLLHYINDHQLSEQQIAILFIQIFSGVRFLHKLNIVHRDLKFENVLLQDNKVVITDFGLGDIADPSKTIQTATTMCGSSHYMAPEILSGHYNAQLADIYSLGVMLYVAVMKEFPFQGKNDFELIQNAQKFQYKQPKCSEQLQDLIQSILKSANQRAQWDQIFHSQFVEKYVDFVNDNTLKIKGTNLQCKFMPTSQEFQIIEKTLHNLAKIPLISDVEGGQIPCPFCGKQLEYLSNAEVLNYTIKKAVSLNKFKPDPLESLGVCAYALQIDFPSQQIQVMPHKGRVVIPNVFECGCYMGSEKKIYARVGCFKQDDFTRFQQCVKQLNTQAGYKQQLQKFKILCE